MTTQTETTNGNRPTHHVFMVRGGDGPDQKGFWTRIGAVWPTKDGNGFTQQLDCVPLTGRLVILPVEEQPDA